MSKFKFLISLLIVLLIFLQKNKIILAQEDPDSLIIFYLEAETELERAILADKLMWKYYGYNPDSLLVYIKRTIKHSQAVKDTRLKWKLYKDIGVFYNVLGYSLNSLLYLHKALDIANKLNDTLRLTKTYMYLGRAHRSLKDYRNALKNFKNEYELFKNYTLADPVYKARNLYDLGVMYKVLGFNDSSMLFFKKSLEAYNALEQKNIPFNAEKPGIIYMNLGNYKKAIQYFKKAMVLDTTDYMKIIQYSNIAEAHLKLKNYPEAKNYLLKAINVPNFTNYTKVAIFTYSLLHKVYYNLHDYKNAYLAQQQYLKFFKKLTEINNKRATEDVALIYQYEEKLKLDSLRHVKELELKDLQLQKQRQKEHLLSIIVVLSLIIVAVTVILLLILKKNLKIIKKQAKFIEAQNARLLIQKSEIRHQRDLIKEKNAELRQLIEEIQKQKEHIELINRELEQSITYASDLQKTLLPDLQRIINYFSEVFILYKPMSKVSGDFYWWTFQGDEVIITMADCTGHGVPGAFMSILGITLLKEIVHDRGILQTDKILNELRLNVINMLGQKRGKKIVKDGMDISIIRFNRITKKIQYSGANNPIYIIRRKKQLQKNTQLNIDQQLNIDHQRIKILEDDTNQKILFEFIPDRMPVAFYLKMERFSYLEFQALTGDMIYMFTDGYADQFGGPYNKKFSYKRLKQLLLSISNLPAERQFYLLEQELEQWKGNNPQIDDITILGLRV